MAITCSVLFLIGSLFRQSEFVKQMFASSSLLTKSTCGVRRKKLTLLRGNEGRCVALATCCSRKEDEDVDCRKNVQNIEDSDKNTLIFICEPKVSKTYSC